MGADNQAEKVIQNIEYREKVFASHWRLLAAAKLVLEVCSSPTIQAAIAHEHLSDAVAAAEELRP